MPKPVPQITAPLPQLRAPYEAVAALQDYLHEAAGAPAHGPLGQKRGRAMGRLILAGLRALRRDDDLRDLSALAERVRASIRTLGEIDMSEAPCPPTVDPRWWRSKQADEHARAREQFRAALDQANQATKELRALVDQMRRGDL